MGVGQDVDEEVTLIKEAMGADIDISFDCAGFEKTMTTALKCNKSGGQVCLVGMGHNHMDLPITPAAARFQELSLSLSLGVLRMNKQ
jgi:L-iditol 2-dehydrogenase